MFEKEAEIYALSNFGFRGKNSQRVLTAKIDYQYGAEFGYNKGKNEAKEIIKKISGFIQTFGCGPSTDKLVAEAQQFLKESE